MPSADREIEHDWVSAGLDNRWHICHYSAITMMAASRQRPGAEVALQGLSIRQATPADTVNPARRLYERHGFGVVETRTDPTYERYTGIAGRHLMVKELS